MCRTGRWRTGECGWRNNLYHHVLPDNRLILGRAKPDARVSSVAERLVGRAAAATQKRRGDAIDRATGPGADLEIAGHAERTVGLRPDRQAAAAHRERLGLAGRWL